MSNILEDLYRIENIKATIRSQEIYLNQLRDDLEALEADFIERYGEKIIELQIEQNKSGLQVKEVMNK